jgi:hypothetical protein
MAVWGALWYIDCTVGVPQHNLQLTAVASTPCRLSQQYRTWQDQYAYLDPDVDVELPIPGSHMSQCVPLGSCFKAAVSLSCCINSKKWLVHSGKLPAPSLHVARCTRPSGTCTGLPF